MAMNTRRPGDPMAAAEAVFKRQAKPAVETRGPTVLPQGRETVSIRIDSDVLGWFQAEGPGWQDRIIAALRAASGLDGPAETGKRPEDLNATNDD